MKPNCKSCIHREHKSDFHFRCKYLKMDVLYSRAPVNCEGMSLYRKVFKKTCKGCGEEYETVDRYQQYCSMSCARTYAYNRNIKRNRPFTNDTVHIVKMWHRKGDSVRTIANILNRPVEVIEGILRGDYDDK